MSQNRRRTAVRRALAVALFVAITATGVSDARDARATVAAASTVSEATVDLAERGWRWPATGFRVEKPYVAPAHEYGPGHRGVDLRLGADQGLRAPADGVVAFSGMVAGRGILTIDHGDGLVTTLEPIDSALAPGAAVRRGERVGALALGGHAEPGAVHFGVRLHGEYINPLLLLGGVPRAVLLPCC